MLEQHLNNIRTTANKSLFHLALEIFPIENGVRLFVRLQTAEVASSSSAMHFETDRTLYIRAGAHMSCRRTNRRTRLSRQRQSKRLPALAGYLARIRNNLDIHC